MNLQRRSLGRALAVAALACVIAAPLVGCRRSTYVAKKKKNDGPALVDKRTARPADPEPEIEEPPTAPYGHVYAKARFTWIRRRPNPDSDWLGYITLGQRVAIRKDPSAQYQGTGCPNWVAVEPKGFVCVGRDATLDANDPTFQRLQEHKANLTSAWPFDYARSLGAPRYRTLPTERDQKAREGDIAVLLAKIEKAKVAPGDDAIAAIDKRLVGVELDLSGAPPPPAFEPSHAIMETDEDVPVGSTIAYTYEFDQDGRAWLLGWDHSVTPQVRVKKYPRSPFRGVELTDDIELPIAFVRKQGAFRVKIGSTGAPAMTEETFDAHQMLELGGRVVESEGRKFYETKEPGVFVSEKDAVIVAPKGELPRNLPAEGRRTWVEVSTVGGWLVAYEGKNPVFATAISAGRAALNPDGSMVPSSSTPIGTYTIKNKLRTATMRNDRHPDRVHAEVMYTQVFHEDYALHGAYWHDDWGDRRSAGCVNLSPIDSKWVFDWSEPALPEEWHARKVDGGDAATIVVVHY